MAQKMKIKRWKQWYQVQYMGHTIEQFLSFAEADAYRQANKMPDPCLQRVSQTFGQTIRHIIVYP